MKDIIRVGLIGLGQRGTKTLLRYFDLQHALITDIADIDPQMVENALHIFQQHRQPVETHVGEKAWESLFQKADIDLIYICTSWESHTPLAVKAMLSGKDVAVEVPAATTLDECHLLVKTAEQTGKKCFMAENCCYDLFHLGALQLQQHQILGEINHFEGAYIHNFLSPKNWERQTQHFKREWMKEAFLRHRGNPYPTHAIGPISQLLSLNGDDDKMDFLVSMTAPGNINTTLIHTLRHRTILLQFDVTTNRPYNRLQTLSGTKGFMQKYPVATLQTAADKLYTDAAAWKQLEPFLQQSDAAQRWYRGHEKGVENEMNYAMDSRLIHCLRYDLPLDINVRDAALWSAIAPLSRKSVLEGSRPQKIPQF